MKRIRFLAAVTGGLVLAAVSFTADARDPSAATDAAAGQLGTHVTAVDMPARLSAQLALAGRRLDPAGPFDAALAAAANRYAHVTRAVDPGLGLPDAAVAAPDHALLFAAYEDGTVRSWDTATGIQRGVGSYPDATVVQLAYDPVHRLLASGDNRGEVEFWQVGPDGEIFPPVLAPGQNRVGQFAGSTRSVGFYASGSRLVAVTVDGDLFAWSLTWNGGILATDFTTVTPRYAGEQPEISASSTVVEATSGVPAHIVVALDDGDVVSVELPGARWPSAATAIPARVLIPRGALPATPIVSLAVRPGDANQLAAATVDGILVWDLSAKRRIAWPAAGLSPGIGADVSFTADGSWLVSSGSGGVDAVPAARYAATAVVRAFAGSVDFASADGRVGALLVTGDGMLCLLDLAHDALLQESAAAEAYGLGFTGGGTLLATSAQGVSVPGDAAPRYRVPGSSVDLYALVVTPSFVAVGAQLDVSHSGVLVWTGPGVAARTLAFDDKVLDAPSHLLYLPEDRLLIARGAAGEIVAWSTTTWTERFRVVPGLGSDLAYDPSRRLLLAAVSVGARADSPAAGTRSRWAAVDLGGQVRPDRTAMPPPFQVAQAAGGGPIAVLTTGNDLVITGPAGVNPGDPIPLGALATAVAVSPDGARVAVATDDARITVFDTVSRRALYAVPATRRPAHLTYVGALAWDPAGRRVAASVGSLDDRLFVPQAVATVTVDPQAWATRLCQVFRPGLTAAEWRRYAGPGLPYRDPCEVG